MEKALEERDEKATEEAIQKILLMQAGSFFIGGLPMLFYGEELGYTNAYSYREDPAKSYDNRWMHRPLIDWEKMERINRPGTVEERVFSATQRLLRIRKSLPVLADYSNLTWLPLFGKEVAAFIREREEKKVYCLFNYSSRKAEVNKDGFEAGGSGSFHLYDHWGQQYFTIGDKQLNMAPYSFLILERAEG